MTSTEKSRLEDLLTRDFSFGRRRFPAQKKLTFYTDLNILISAGLDIKTALDLTKENFKKAEDRAVIEDIAAKLVAGASFSGALNLSSHFSKYEYYSIKIGEETGRLKEVLKEISRFYKNRIDQRKKIINAFSYPVIVLITTIAAMVFLLNFIVPLFADVFQRLDAELPAITRRVIEISGFASRNFFRLLLLFTVITLSLYMARKTSLFRKLSSALVLKIPFFGEIIRKMYLARMCLGFSLLTGARTPLIEAIKLLREMVSFYPIEHSLAFIEQEILKGYSLSHAMQSFPVYDRRMITLLRVGEEVNQLELIFNTLKDQYNADIDYHTGMISGIMEPLLIGFIGIFVAIVLISMYLPIFQLSTSFSI